MALVKCTTAVNNSSYQIKVGDILDSTHAAVVAYPSSFSSTVGLGTSEAASLKGSYYTGTIAVTVPAIGAANQVGSVDVDISSDPLVFAAAVGDFVVAIPQEAMETNARIVNAYVIAADSVRVVFASSGGAVTGGAKNFKFYVTDLT